MKPNRTNSFRLQRVSRASSLKRHSQTFYQADESFRLAAINSVSKGVKFNETTPLVGDNLHKLRKEPHPDKDQLYQVCHIGLTETRKKYDDMKKQRVKMDQNIYRLKEDIKKYRIFENEFNDKISKGNNSVESLSQDLLDKKNLLEITMFQKKVLQSMRHRLRTDKVVYDQRKFDLQKEHSFQSKQLSIFKGDEMELKEMEDRTDKIFRSFKAELREEQNEREQHIYNLERMIQENAENQDFNVKRGKEIYEIAERAMLDKNPNEKEWYNIYLTNQFVNKMLRHKIDREMMKFSTVELAFKTIKTATGVSDTETLIYKYLNKEAVYGDLLGRITANEKKIANLKEEQEDLVKEQRELEMEKDTIMNIKLKSTDITHDLNNLEVMDELRTKVERDRSAIEVWLQKQYRKFSTTDPIRAVEYLYDKNVPVSQNFVTFLKHLSVLSDQCNKEDLDEKTDVGDLTARDSARVTRVMPKRSRKNSAGEEIFDVEEEEVPMGVDEEEGEMVDLQREEVLRNNEKFMKEARRRMEEVRKIMIEKDKGKEKEKKPEVKKEDD